MEEGVGGNGRRLSVKTAKERDTHTQHTHTHTLRLIPLTSKYKIPSKLVKNFL